MHKQKQLDSLIKQAIPAVSAAIKLAVETEGLVITDSEMFKYSKCYTGQAWGSDDHSQMREAA